MFHIFIKFGLKIFQILILLYEHTVLLLNNTLILLTFVYCSKSSVPDALLVAIQDADSFLAMLHDLSAMGAAMRRVMTGALTNPQVSLKDYCNISLIETVC